MKHQYHKDGTTPNDGSIFVFGSNEAGRHGLGSALAAVKHFGAIYGQGEGLQGSSYGIPTKGKKLEVLPIETIQKNIEKFLEFAQENQDKQFFITRIGCGLAGYKDSVISQFFVDAPANCNMPDKWRQHFKKHKNENTNKALTC